MEAKLKISLLLGAGRVFVIEEVNRKTTVNNKI